MRFEKPSPPSDDKRWKIVDRTMRSHGYEPHALIQTLHTAQETFGYLDLETMKYVSAALRVPLSQVYGVATFYHFFTLKPHGEHTCVVCTGTACYIKGAQDLLDAVEDVTGAKPGETSADGKVSVLTARCLGACGLAPAAVLDGEMAGKIGTDDIKKRVRNWTEIASESGGTPPSGIPTAPPEGPAPQNPTIEGVTAQ
ncbi:MAG TPA: bidirectional hydrogenase complex protein HoxE [Anaerolineae bacterium]|nr:bidirectional hydrogenase complex protein HoxE [Anaerolineae bacterium]